MDPVAAKPASDLLTSTGIIAVLGAVGFLTTTLITAWTALKAKAQLSQVQETNAVQTRLLGGITLLVDGKYGELLKELADIKLLFARETGDRVDLAAAARAQGDSTAQQERTKVATEALAAGLPVEPGEAK